MDSRLFVQKGCISHQRVKFNACNAQEAIFVINQVQKLERFALKVNIRHRVILKDVSTVLKVMHAEGEELA